MAELVRKFGESAGDPKGSPGSCVRAGHEVLFEADGPICAVCSAPLSDEDDDGFAVPGRGLFMWARGEELRFEEPALCPDCASAIGVSALRQWEIEEEEG